MYCADPLKNFNKLLYRIVIWFGCLKHSHVAYTEGDMLFN
jgi:hypothetical protein